PSLTPYSPRRGGGVKGGAAAERAHLDPAWAPWSAARAMDCRASGAKSLTNCAQRDVHSNRPTAPFIRDDRGQQRQERKAMVGFHFHCGMPVSPLLIATGETARISAEFR